MAVPLAGARMPDLAKTRDLHTSTPRTDTKLHLARATEYYGMTALGL